MGVRCGRRDEVLSFNHSLSLYLAALFFGSAVFFLSFEDSLYAMVLCFSDTFSEDDLMCLFFATLT